MTAPAALRLIHPAPAFAVVALTAALAGIVSLQAGGLDAGRIALVVLGITGSQIATGASNDWADRERDRAARPEKPIPAGDLSATAALEIAGLGVALQLGASLPAGLIPTLIGLAGLASALAYNLWLSRTPLSVVPYLVSFGLLPIWIASIVGVPVTRVLPAVPLVAPFAGAAHLANTLRDWEADAAGGSHSLAQVLGRGPSRAIVIGLVFGVGLLVPAAFIVAGRLTAASAILGVVGLGAVAQGVRNDRALWYGMLVAAVAWTAAWALATG